MITWNVSCLHLGLFSHIIVVERFGPLVAINVTFSMFGPTNLWFFLLLLDYIVLLTSQLINRFFSQEEEDRQANFSLVPTILEQLRICLLADWIHFAPVSFTICQ